MDVDIELRPGVLERDGVRLAYVEAGPDAPADPPMVFIHGLIGDHRALLPQIEHFAWRRRVVAVVSSSGFQGDGRGDGGSVRRTAIPHGGARTGA